MGDAIRIGPAEVVDRIDATAAEIVDSHKMPPIDGRQGGVPARPGLPELRLRHREIGFQRRDFHVLVAIVAAATGQEDDDLDGTEYLGCSHESSLPLSEFWVQRIAGVAAFLG